MYRALEFRLLRESDHVVAITEDFRPILIAKGVDAAKIAVIENWAPLDELPRHPRDNDWATANMPGEGVRIVYSGTLGYKHNPGLLMALARELPDAHVHVFSEGRVADGLAAAAKGAGARMETIARGVTRCAQPRRSCASLWAGAGTGSHSRQDCAI